MPDGVNLYGATVAGVAGLLPNRSIDDQSRPSATDVEGYIDDVAGRVYARVGPPHQWPDLYPDGTDGRRLELIAGARDLVHLGAAAYTEDASYPERARADTTDQAYGAVLWRRFLSGLEVLARTLELAEADAPDGTSGGVAGSFPTPHRWAKVRW